MLNSAHTCALAIPFFCSKTKAKMHQMNLALICCAIKQRMTWRSASHGMQTP